MTTVFSNVADRAQMHAFIIGVDSYPYCGLNTKLKGGAGDFARELKTIECAARSARRVAQWLLDNQCDDAVVPLGSIELNLSPTQVEPFKVEPFNSRAVGRATFQDIEASFNRWYVRCDTREDNVAFLFFCGHGCEIERNDILLLEDVGDDGEHLFLANAIDFHTTFWAMRKCKARVQCYFIDACRNEPVGNINVHAARPLIEGFPKTPCNSQIVYSTTAGNWAYGHPDESHLPTPFTTALLASLDFGAAVQRKDGWRIYTDRLCESIETIMQRYGVSQPPGQFGEGSGGVLRALPGAPMVPFRLGCSPPQATASARLQLVSNGRLRERGPALEPWKDSAVASIYHVYALFDAGDFADAAKDADRVRFFVPPSHEWDIPVQPSSATPGAVSAG